MNEPVAPVDDLSVETVTATEFPKTAHVWGVAMLTLIAMIAVGLVAFDLFGNFAMVIAEVMIVVPAMLYLQTTGISKRAVFRLRPIDTRIGLLSIATGFTLPVVANALDTALGEVYPMPERMRRVMEEMLTADNAGDFMLIAAGLVFAAAICEELFFRGFLQHSLERRYGPVWAILTASLAFGVVHINPWWFLSILFAGVVCGILAYTTGSVWPGIIVHGMNNGLSLLIVNAKRSEQWAWFAELEHVTLQTTLICGIVLMTTLVWFFKLSPQSPVPSHQD